MANTSRKCDCACLSSSSNKQPPSPFKVTALALTVLCASYVILGEKGALLSAALVIFVCNVVDAKQ